MSEKTLKPIFDIPEIGGLNDSERFLAELCHKSFLSLWSFSNLFTDEDQRNGRGSAKELCDVLVVFGNDVIIFSDKHIIYQADKPVEVAWPRWYKRAVAASADQLYGAMNWLMRFPNRVFLDAKCTRRLPVEVPPADRARYHLVAVTRGTLEACKEYFKGGFGTHFIDTGVSGKEHWIRPFQIGMPNPTKRFVHVFDEFSLELLHREFDTVSDLTAYLTAREELLNEQSRVVSADGEEQLLAAYLKNMRDNVHSFLPEDVEQEGLRHIHFDRGLYEHLHSHPNYLAKKEADRISYDWDNLIERLIKFGNPALVRPDLDHSDARVEEGLRIIAAESRFRRRSLIYALRSVFQLSLSRPNERRARIITSDQVRVIYIFLILPKVDKESYEAYRLRRAHYLEAYCRCAKLKFPEADTFVGLAFDHPVKNYEGASEDLIVVKINELSPEERRNLESLRHDLGILANSMTEQPYHAIEFPQAQRQLGSKVRLVGTRDIPQAKASKTVKARKIMARASRRRNRK